MAPKRKSAASKPAAKGKGKAEPKPSPTAQLQSVLLSGAECFEIEDGPADEGGSLQKPAVDEGHTKRDDPSETAAISSDFEDLPEGKLDNRAYSKMQKRVFDNNFKFLSAEVQTEWLELAKPGGAPGKQKRKNEIVNQEVGRSVNYGGTLKTQDPAYRRTLTVSKKRGLEQQEVGISETAMKLKYGALYDEAVQKGDIWGEENGLWYERSETRTTKRSSNDTQEMFKGGTLSQKDAIGFEIEMTKEVDSWANLDFNKMITIRPSSSSGGQSMGAASDDLMARLQESFDATNGLVMRIKKVAQEIMSVTSVTPHGMEMVQRGMILCKDLQKCMDEIETLLCSYRATIKWEHAVTALQNTATPFLHLEKFLEELTALHKVYVPKKQKCVAPPPA